MTDKDLFVLLNFHADWCSPCITMDVILKELDNELFDKLKILKIDVDQHKAMAVRFKIKSVPTFILFREGEQVWRKSGLLSKRDLKDVMVEFGVV